MIKSLELSPIQINQIIELAWQDDVSFDQIKSQFGCCETQVIALMRRSLKSSSFRCWRKRVNGRIRKHAKKVDQKLAFEDIRNEHDSVKVIKQKVLPTYDDGFLDLKSAY